MKMHSVTRWLLQVSLLMLLLSFVIACSKAPSALSENTSAASNLEIAKDSLRAKFKLEMPDGKGKLQKFDAVMFSVPGKRYRLELSGPMGIGVASVLWTDTLWTIVFPTEKKFLKGNGYMVGMLDQPDFPLVNVHQIAAFFEQKFLPESFEEISSQDSAGIRIVSAKEESGMMFRFAESSEKKVLWLERGAEKAVFEWPRISVFKNGCPYLNLQVKKVEKDISFRGTTWRLPVPHGYEKL